MQQLIIMRRKISSNKWKRIENYENKQPIKSKIKKWEETKKRYNPPRKNKNGEEF